MTSGRATGADEQDARALAQRLVDEARADAERLRETARAEIARARRDAEHLAGRIVQDARVEAERLRVRPARGEGERGGGEPGAADGAVDEVVGTAMRATVPGAAMGERVEVDRAGGPRLVAEVVGVRGAQVVVLPLGEVAGVAPASGVWRTAGPPAIRCGEDVLGRVLDGIGEPLDGGPALAGELWPVDRPAPAALSRPVIAAPQPTGVRAIDAMLTLGRGQRVGLFGAAGAGASTLLGQIARGASADVVVWCLVGARGGELAELVGELAPVRQRSVVVCATSDAPPLARLRAAATATAIAEWFRERCGAAVVLLCDSLTGVARAQREVGLAAGEVAGRDGYPPSVFALLPRLMERAGATPKGAITAIYAVVAGDRGAEGAIADEVRGLVDGHLALDRGLAERGQFPSIDVMASASRGMRRVVGADHAEAAARIRARLRSRRSIAGDGEPAPAAFDDAVRLEQGLAALVNQRRDEVVDWDASLAALLTLAGPG